ncbi:IS6 family transposase, partial [Escherichia coli]|nr:IS6 family transposase [Escherichia coli]
MILWGVRWDCQYGLRYRGLPGVLAESG